MIEGLGRTLLSIPEWLGRLLFLLFDLGRDLVRLLRHQYSWRLFGLLRKQTLFQVWYTAIEAIPLFLLIAIGFGGLLIGMGFQTLQRVGAEDIFIPFLRYGIIGELIPLGISLIILARSSTAMTADVASQVINGELDVMRAHGMSIPLLITFPRIIGMWLSLFSLIALFIVIFAGSTFLWAPLFDISTKQIQQIWSQALTQSEFEWAGLKLLFFGLLISLIACYKAIHVQRDIRELPKVSSQSVVLTLFAVFLMEGVLLFARWFT